jgi:hypothetical protein
MLVQAYLSERVTERHQDIVDVDRSVSSKQVDQKGGKVSIRRALVGNLAVFARRQVDESHLGRILQSRICLLVTAQQHHQGNEDND